jgi:hypothetical protein
MEGGMNRWMDERERERERRRSRLDGLNADTEAREVHTDGRNKGQSL